ncbi:hypothetical protein [Streptomyces sp. ISL-100]|uniref:hypothetical protein n=1 Tax=Streptomyces sp. ISL-100 TaxID=2819173 RepID=UPI001BE8808D|nr:hypothetical protein [Streptomyces sp. ISL-100]MBT2401065.1 hypothetical protein [Streptomyces sp. ISL-100]
MSEINTAPETPEAQTEAVPDPAEEVRAGIHRENAGKLAQAELKAQAAQAGIKLPDGYTDYLDTSKLLGEDGNPSAESIGEALKPFEPKFPPLAGTLHNRGSAPLVHHFSLDARRRK